MPTVIDSLLIELGLDTSKFDAAQKKSVEQLRKFDEQQRKTSKRTQEDAQKTTQEFNKATQSVLEYFLAYAGVSQIKEFVATNTKANTELARSSHLLSMSAQELKTWGDVAEITGGNVETMTSSLQGLQESLVQIKRGNAEILKPAAMLGALGAFDINRNTVDLYKLADAIANFKKTHTEAEAYSWAKSLGIDQKTFLLLEQGSEALRKQYNDYDALNNKVKENSESASQLTKEWIETKKQAESLGSVIYNKLATPLSFLNKGLQYSILGFKSLFSGSLDPLRESARRKVEERTAALSEGGANQGVSATGANLAPRNIRNNNPGNLRFGSLASALSAGAIGIDKDGFARFPNMEAGKFAQMRLLQNKYASGLDTIRKIYTGSGAVKGWLGSGADLKDAPSAISNVSALTGFGADQKLTKGQLEILRQAMERNEGSMVGAKVNTPPSSRTINNTSEVNIQNMNIHTQATDALGLSKDLPRHIQNNSLINSGILGAD